MNLLDRLHGACVHRRRVARLADALAPLLPDEGVVLDVGCGDGTLARALALRKQNLEFRGLDVLVRPDVVIPVEPFDGRRIPVEDGAAAAVLLVDVLHHADDPRALLAEAGRAGRCIVVKDHVRQGVGAATLLRIMDWVGNARHGVALPGRYWDLKEWDATFAALRLRPLERHTQLGLYPWPANWLFERGMHFAARLERAGPEDVS